MQAERPKTKVSVSDLRKLMGTADDGWGDAGTRTASFGSTSKLTKTVISIRTGLAGRSFTARWAVRNGLGWGRKRAGGNQSGNSEVRSGAGGVGGTTEERRGELGGAIGSSSGGFSWGMETATEAGCEAAEHEPPGGTEPSDVLGQRGAVGRSEPAGETRWLTQIEVRKLIAEDADFADVTTGETLDEHACRRYATGAKGGTAQDRHYLAKHILMQNGDAIIGPDGSPLAEPPPAPLISNPVVRKAIHEVRRHLVEYMVKFRRKPDYVFIELAREARMGKKDADRLLFEESASEPD